MLKMLTGSKKMQTTNQNVEPLQKMLKNVENVKNVNGLVCNYNIFGAWEIQINMMGLTCTRLHSA